MVNFESGVLGVTPGVFLTLALCSILGDWYEFVGALSRLLRGSLGVTGTAAGVDGDDLFPLGAPLGFFGVSVLESFTATGVAAAAWFGVAAAAAAAVFFKISFLGGDGSVLDLAGTSLGVCAGVAGFCCSGLLAAGVDGAAVGLEGDVGYSRFYWRSS